MVKLKESVLFLCSILLTVYYFVVATSLIWVFFFFFFLLYVTSIAEYLPLTICYKYYIKSIESDFGRKNISCYMAPSSLCFSVTLPQYFFVCSISIIHKNQATRVMTGSINNKKIIDGFHRIDCLFYSCFSFCHLSFQNFHRSRIY